MPDAMRFAPVLQEVAAQLAGRPATSMRDDPVAWAYALREAVGVVEPDVVVSHLDPTLEHDALAPLVAEAADPVDAVLDAAPLAALHPTCHAVELVRTLAGAGGGRPIAATITGPATLAAALAPGAGDPDELAEVCGDALAAYAAVLAEAGAAIVVVVETAGFVAGAHAPIVRALRLHAVEPVLSSGAEGAADAGYPALARGWQPGQGPAPVALVPGDPEAWPQAGVLDGVDLLLTSTAVPPDADLAVVRRSRRALAGVV